MKTAIHKILILFFLSQVSNCLLFDTLGIAPGRIKGSEAGNQIKDAAIVTDVVNTTVFSGRPSTLILSLIADQVAAIKTDGYYVQSEVDDCVAEIKGLTGYVLGSFLTIVLQSKCTLEEDKTFLDSPFPEI
ncbi:TIGR04452 family lipoprotein [Leptospira gomenensis]|uniref:TIGR04452 family lipoprotein n=1 Tax=Leptospira gomenensis TaxID=2484974 RepID=A0A5F1YKC6_9LEPT|nr:TIGR04452 family lipoprotein [Leptospira gomenensis]TGK33322.1 TIGR04452 family lipoprotein [Leptospira gomenensis]TGK37382.1 TIGR04452 family lipoprotein [Leptospira gomenensis]TGK50870.1 TIGR04452 family lipoprotein [Leptospira gomenensis]TGK56493.1 TIGR04452 family lipoprotein [Leptospira gomenensis]